MNPPRYFWRRVGAFLVYYVLASLVALVLLLPFLGNTDRIRLGDGVISLTRCQSVDTITPSVAAVTGHRRLKTAQVCGEWYNGVYDGLSVTLTYDKVQSAWSTTERTLTLPISAEGELVNPVEPWDGLKVLILWIGAALMIARLAVSPGKRLFGLRVVPDGESETRAISLGRALTREGLKLAPLFLIAAASYILSTIGFGRLIDMLDRLLDNWRGSVSVCLLVVVLLILPYLLSPIRWGGVIFYDYWLGLTVIGPQKRKKAPLALVYDGR